MSDGPVLFNQQINKRPLVTNDVLIVTTPETLKSDTLVLKSIRSPKLGIGGSRGGHRRRMPPQQDQFLSFLHTFLLKSVRIRGWHPSPMGRHPPNGKSWIRHC